MSGSRSGARRCTCSQTPPLVQLEHHIEEAATRTLRNLQPANYVLKTENFSRTLRNLPPANYMFKIENFSSFEKAKADSYESGEFEAGGYKWKLRLFPNGNKKRDVTDHISLYLVFSESNTPPLGWEIHVHFAMFVYNQIKDKYLKIQANGRVIKRFHAMKTEWGFDELLPLVEFKDATQGYVIDDCCAFGAEVFVTKYTGRGECLTMIKDPVNNTFTWTFPKFSTLDKEAYRSQVFVIAGKKWTLLFYPKGKLQEKGKSLSLFLSFEEASTLAAGRKMYTEIKMTVKSQLSENHHFKEDCCYFTATAKELGYSKFLPFEELNTPSKGFLVNDTLIIELQIDALASFKIFS